VISGNHLQNLKPNYNQQRIMKKQLLIGLLLMGTLAAGRAGIYSLGTVDNPGTSLGSLQNTTIVDGNPANLTVNTMNLSSAGLDPSLSSLTVTLNITGGNNSGLYAYLVAPNDATVILMNQPGVSVNGFGATGAGMNITLSDAFTSQGSIQSATSGSVLGGTYNAAGSLSGFGGGNPNGTWTLYFADTIAGGGDATLKGWSLDITAVPEPVNVALGVFGGLAAVFVGRRWFWRQRNPAV
jgi:subtilisin-like proprotein convertase family protein